MKDKKHILFDLDGTITDSKPGIMSGFKYGASYFGLNVTDEDYLNAVIGPPLRASYNKLMGLDTFAAEEAVRQYRIYYEKQGMFECIVYTGVEDLLKALKENGKKIYLCTSKPIVYARRILEHFNLDKYFDFCSGAEFDGTRDKKEDVLSYILTENKIEDLSSCVLIGDRSYDCIGANLCGIDSIGVLYGYGDLDELKNSGATVIAKTPAEIKYMLI